MMGVSRPMTEPVARTSPELLTERAEWLRAVFPEVLTEGKIDLDKLGAVLGDAVDDRPERYSFTWAGKRDAIRLLQAPSRATLVPVLQESVNFEETGNVFIEGENLEVLKLLHKAYFGRVKMIYIDPPYNTGNDFIYPDNYAEPLDTYLRLTGQKDDGGNLLTSNPETSGRYHSAWLSMMYPRLFLARQLLRDDGAIFVSIDDNEMHNLRMLMNELFGEENFLACIVWRRRQVPDNRNINQVSTDHEYVVAYGKGEAVFTGKAKDLSKYSNPDNDPRGPWMSDNMTGLATREQRPNLHYDLVDPETGNKYPPLASRGWLYGRETMNRLIAEKRIIWPSTPTGRPRLKHFLSQIKSRFTGFSTMQDVGYTTDGTREVEALFGERVFPFPKPVSLPRLLCEQATSSDEGDIVLDFFAGSCTTAQAVLELNQADSGNRRFIMVQLPEPAANGAFPTIAKIGKERIRRVLSRVRGDQANRLDLGARETPLDLGCRMFELSPSNFRSWTEVQDTSFQAYTLSMNGLVDPLVDGFQPQNTIWEIVLKEGLSLASRVGRVEHVGSSSVYQVTDPDKDQVFLVCLDDDLDPATPDALGLSQDDLFICRDGALTDELAANLALQCRLKTI